MSKKKIKEIFIGSNNEGKLKEIADMLPKSLKIYSNLDFKIPSPKETGTSFEQNSLLKAKYFSNNLQALIGLRDKVYDLALKSPLFDTKSFTINFENKIDFVLKNELEKKIVK